MPRDGTRRTDRLAAGVKALAERSSVRKQDRRSAGRRSPRIPMCGAMAHRPEKHRLPCNPPKPHKNIPSLSSVRYSVRSSAHAKMEEVKVAGGVEADLGWGPLHTSAFWS